MVEVFEISKKVFVRLSKMDSERDGGNSLEQLIFPLKIQAKGEKRIKRVSEQELRLLFIEEFKLRHPNLYYSIETPTLNKFKIDKLSLEMYVDLEGRSALHDMCIFEKLSDTYKRILNIEFKHRNRGVSNSAKDILKLIQEEQNGVFIHLLENTDSGTLNSVFKKLYHSFSGLHKYWNNENKSIQLIIFSLNQKKLVSCKITKGDLINLEEIFYVEKGFENIEAFKGINWIMEELKEIRC